MASTCERDGCANELPAAGRGRIPRYCSGRCRVAAHRAKAKPPAELTEGCRWVRHSARKVPLTVDGKAASSTDPATWSTYAEACRSEAGTGLGCVLTGDGIVCLDLDHCLDESGRPLPWAIEVLAQTPRTWVEISPSGDGLHIWGRAVFPGGRRLARPGQSVEVYGSGRYITVTGRRYDGAPAELADLTELIAAIV